MRHQFVFPPLRSPQILMYNKKKKDNGARTSVLVAFLNYAIQCVRALSGYYPVKYFARVKQVAHLERKCILGIVQQCSLETVS